MQSNYGYDISSGEEEGVNANQIPESHQTTNTPLQPIIQITLISVQLRAFETVKPPSLPLWMDVPSRKRPAFAGMTVLGGTTVLSGTTEVVQRSQRGRGIKRSSEQHRKRSAAPTNSWYFT